MKPVLMNSGNRREDKTQASQGILVCQMMDECSGKATVCYANESGMCGKLEDNL